MNNENIDYEKIPAKMMVESSNANSTQFMIKSDEEFRRYIQQIVFDTLNEDKYNEMDDEMADQVLESVKKDIILRHNAIKHNAPYIKQDFTFHELTNNLKEILKDRGISLEKLAELIGVSRNTMTSIVNNKGTSAINMFKISKVLGLPIDKIFRYELCYNEIFFENYGKEKEE